MPDCVPKRFYQTEDGQTCLERDEYVEILVLFNFMIILEIVVCTCSSLLAVKIMRFIYFM